MRRDGPLAACSAQEDRYAAYPQATFDRRACNRAFSCAAHVRGVARRARLNLPALWTCGRRVRVHATRRRRCSRSLLTDHRVFLFAPCRSDAHGRQFRPPSTHTFAFTLDAVVRRQLAGAERSHRYMGRMHRLVGRVASLLPLEVDFRVRLMRQRANPAHDTFHQKVPPEAVRHRLRGSWVSQTRNQPVLGPVDDCPRFRLFWPSAPRWGTGTGGSEATSPKMCAQCGISSKRGPKSGVCKNFHSNRRLGDGAPTALARRRGAGEDAARARVQ